MSAVTRESVQQEVREWLNTNWDPQLSLQAWRERLVDSGWAVPSWSSECFGRDLPAWVDQIVADELRLIGAVGNPLGSGMSLAAPTIVEHGSDELKRLILRQTLTGEKTWCQLFSEPGAGSDLASLSTSARRFGIRVLITPTTECCWHERIVKAQSTTEFLISFCRCISLVLKCVQSNR
jgi:alkylation response protein AidB-like acyl-CoA dehydrogenase